MEPLSIDQHGVDEDLDDNHDRQRSARVGRAAIIRPFREC
jgi:hypothetical protein